MQVATTNLKRYWTAFLDLVYTRTCPGCGGSMLFEEKIICLDCQIDLPINPYFHLESNPVKQVLAGRLPLEMANSLLFFHKNGIAQGLLHALKYHDREDIGIFLGELLGEKLSKTRYKPDVILPVPLHPSKQKKRGYNQCHSIALGVQRTLGGAISFDAIERVKANTSQTKLNRIQRWDNVSGIFELKKPEMLSGKHILILDDTLTTGATLESFGATALKAGNVTLGMAAVALAH